MVNFVRIILKLVKSEIPGRVPQKATSLPDAVKYTKCYTVVFGPNVDSRPCVVLWSAETLPKRSHLLLLLQKVYI